MIRVLFVCGLAFSAVSFYAVQLIRYRHLQHLECTNAQVIDYGDLCAEATDGYEYMTPEAAHYSGVKCAVESIKQCESH